MLEIKEKQTLPLEESIKIIDIFPDNKVVYLYGDSEKGHLACFKELNDQYINNLFISQMLQEERLFTIEDYLIKSNHILLVNLTPKLATTPNILVLLQDSTTETQQQLLIDILENSALPYFQLCIHNEDNRYGEYHYHETTETTKSLKKRRTMSSLFI